MKDLRITLIQTSLNWENIEANIVMFENHLSKIPKDSTDIIILPEMFNTGFTMNNKANAEKMNEQTMIWMALKAKEKNCVITGSMIIDEKTKYFNRLIWMMPNGTFAKYDKKHLFRYANEQNFYSPGNDRLVLNLNGWKICPMICYDLRFPVWCRNKFSQKNKEEIYDLMFFVANWPERRSHHWKSLLMARAIENQSYVIGVNRIGEDGNKVNHSGDSTAINPKGEIISKTIANEESVETILLSKNELDEWRKTFPAWMDAD